MGADGCICGQCVPNHVIQIQIRHVSYPAHAQMVCSSSSVIITHCSSFSMRLDSLFLASHMMQRMSCIFFYSFLFCSCFLFS